MLRKVLHNARKRKMLSDVPTMPFSRGHTAHEFTDVIVTPTVSSTDTTGSRRQSPGSHLESVFTACGIRSVASWHQRERLN